MCIDERPLPANHDGVDWDHELHERVYRVAPSAQALSGPFSSVGYKSAPQSRPSSCLEAARVADRPKTDRDSAASLFPRRHPAGTTQWQSRKISTGSGTGSSISSILPTYWKTITPASK